jgi:hypothetical protein
MGGERFFRETRMRLSKVSRQKKCCLTVDVDEYIIYTFWSERIHLAGICLLD